MSTQIHIHKHTAKCGTTEKAESSTMVVNFTHYITNLPAAVIVGENSSIFVIRSDSCDKYKLMIRGISSTEGTVLFTDIDPLKVIRVYSAVIEAYANGCKLLNILDKGTITTV